ncbi:hypothetical protein TPY_1154 [Sulfobacillus acidophilus TPY]|uniref:Uncharacterized protein n=1 Tax=Sulfobacillus acidophilus (strain ATCC 700253 / DSM 10332 / NAL) TaxID=679936 RepID=G8TW31_SULAD|nr:hypothetical protein TPY_1154 [Sulfobacillus acidophilus TPY]AEW05958.1 hypothetical protein Sulac_2496 [Sulfobacillus acidophilus DSM 10332]
MTLADAIERAAKTLPAFRQEFREDLLLFLESYFSQHVSLVANPSQEVRLKSPDDLLVAFRVDVPPFGVHVSWIWSAQFRRVQAVRMTSTHTVPLPPWCYTINDAVTYLKQRGYIPSPSGGVERPSASYADLMPSTLTMPDESSMA